MEAAHHTAALVLAHHVDRGELTGNRPGAAAEACHELREQQDSEHRRDCREPRCGCDEQRTAHKHRLAPEAIQENANREQGDDGAEHPGGDDLGGEPSGDVERRSERWDRGDDHPLAQAHDDGGAVQPEQHLVGVAQPEPYEHVTELGSASHTDGTLAPHGDARW